MDLMEAIYQRRSVRRYKPDPVREEDLNAILDAARWAPSWANTQCWSLVVVRDAGVKAALADTLNPTNPALKSITEAPVVIVACAEVEKSGWKKGEPVTDKGDYWYMFDVALAMQNLVLAAHSLGLATVHVGLFDARRAATVLGLPPGVVCVEMTPLGYADEAPEAPPRKELAEIVFHNSYGQA